MELIEAMRVEYGLSKEARRRALIATTLLYFVAIISIFGPSGWLAIGLGVASVIAQIILFVLRHLSDWHFGSGEQIRRTAMLQDALGLKPSEIEIAKLRERIEPSQSVEPDYLGPYYESKLPVGPKRLLEITAESAFFTGALSRTTTQVFGGIASVGVLVVITGLVVVTQAGVSQPILDAIAKIAVISMLSWATGDITSMALRFHSLSQAAGRILDRCDSALSRDGELRDEAMVVFGEYNCSVLRAAPIPAIVYKWRQGVLNEAWRKRRSQKGSN